jgi:hypothetical protein
MFSGEWVSGNPLSLSNEQLPVVAHTDTSSQQIWTDEVTNEQVETINFGFLMTLGSEDYCLDFSAWCDNIKVELMTSTDFGTIDYGASFVHLNTMCLLAKHILRDSMAFVVATGSLNLTHCGENDIISQIKMFSNVDHASLAIASSDVIADPTSTLNSSAIAYTDADKLCSSADSKAPWSEYFCGNGEGNVIGTAEATGVSTGTGVGQSGHVQSTHADVTIRGANIRRFSSILNVEAESFVLAESQFAVNAVTEAFLRAYSTNYTDTCYSFTENYCESECDRLSQDVFVRVRCVSYYCKSDHCVAGLTDDLTNATKVGTDFAKTFKKSFSQTSFTFTSKLTFDYTEGATLKDMVSFDYNGQGYSNANVSVLCKSDAAAIPLLHHGKTG